MLRFKRNKISHHSKISYHNKIWNWQFDQSIQRTWKDWRRISYKPAPERKTSYSSTQKNTLHNIIERHFGDIKALIAIHDDLIISAVSPSENDKTLRNVLERAKDRIIKFNLKKILLKVPEVKYLGNTVSKEGLKPDSEKIKAKYLKFPCLPKKRTK